MSQTHTQTTLNVDEVIIEHEPLNHLPVRAESASEQAAATEPSKREQARQKRAHLLAEQAKLQQMLDDIEDDGAAEIAKQELVVPKSIPITLAMFCVSK